MIIADTSAWVAYLRSNDSPTHLELQRLLDRSEIVVAGAVLAEVLRGARSAGELDILAQAMRALPYTEVTWASWVRCGEITLTLKQQGVAIGLIDALIAAIAIDGGHDLYTLDSDFQRIPELRLHQPAAA